MDLGGSSALDALARSYPASTVIFEEGDPGSRMYVIRSGRVKITKRVGSTDITLAVLVAGDFFGEMALLEGMPRSAAAVVIEDAALIEVDQATFENLIRRNGEIAAKLMRRLSSRLRDANRQIQALLGRSAVARAAETLRAIAGQASASGWRPLPEDLPKTGLAARCGLQPDEGRRIEARLERAGILTLAPAGWFMAPDATVNDYLLFLDLRETYEPLTAQELSELSGLPEEEVQHLVRKVLQARLQRGDEGSARLADTYQTYVELKKRFDLGADGAIATPGPA
jgi:CRP-like cAMP-binding protein